MASLMRTRVRALRIGMTDAERKLWNALRNRRLQGYKFRRQQLIGDYIVDFVCLEKKLVIELDGGQHGETKARRYDAARTMRLADHGFCVARFWNHEVLNETDAVLHAILQTLTAPHPPHPHETRTSPWRNS
ncbi:MAG: endonuclease domain-containing protein [Gammaproteobacteria bacterium]